MLSTFQSVVALCWNRTSESINHDEFTRHHLVYKLAHNFLIFFLLSQCLLMWSFYTAVYFILHFYLCLKSLPKTLFCGPVKAVNMNYLKEFFFLF